jgi:hypothetical protein
MNITVLYTNTDNKSHFRTETLPTPIKKPLGDYSLPFASNSVQFREFAANLIFPMHTDANAQYIIYLEGCIEVRASGGETKRFLAQDITGEAHESLTIESGRAVIVGLEKARPHNAI